MIPRDVPCNSKQAAYSTVCFTSVFCLRKNLPIGTHTFKFLFCFVLFSNTGGFLYITTLAVLKLSLQTRQASNSKRSTCFLPPECRDYRCAPPCLAKFNFLFEGFVYFFLQWTLGLVNCGLHPQPCYSEFFLINHNWPIFCLCVNHDDIKITRVFLQK